jgi:hypothetical protein
MKNLQSPVGKIKNPKLEIRNKYKIQINKIQSMGIANE